jgi:hypothetical protein
MVDLPLDFGDDVCCGVRYRLAWTGGSVGDPAGAMPRLSHHPESLLRRVKGDPRQLELADRQRCS